jgi:hypothetical protein
VFDPSLTASHFETIFSQIEKMVDAHPRLRRLPGQSPTIDVSRDGFTLRIAVKVLRSRKKPTSIHQYGETPAEALKALADALDSWALVSA